MQYTRLTRNLHRGFCFEYKNITKKEYWIERGWSELEAIDITTKDKAQRAIRQSETRQKLLQNKDVFIEDGKEKEYKFIFFFFYGHGKTSKTHPIWICACELLQIFSSALRLAFHNVRVFSLQKAHQLFGKNA